MKYTELALKRRLVKVARTYAPGMLEAARNAGFEYFAFVEKLASYSKQTQKRIIRAFYRDFPNGEQVAECMYRLMNVPWFSAESLDGKEDTIRKLFLEHQERVKTFGDGSVADLNAFYIAENAVTDSTRVEAMGVIGDDAWHTATTLCSIPDSYVYDSKGTYDPDEQAAFVSGNYAEYEVLSDLLLSGDARRKNPWDPLIVIYEQGFLFDMPCSDTVPVLTLSGVTELRIKR